MTGLQILGAVILATPFVGLVAVMVRESGWRAAASIWGVTVALVVVCCVGAALLTGDLS